MLCRFKTCNKCRGDLVLDGEEWRCWQCGHYYYPTPCVTDVPPDAEEAKALLPGSGPEPGISANGHAPVRRAARGINLMIAAKDRSEVRWRRKNNDIIRYLDEGRSVREIASLIGRGQRQIRVVRERLRDIRVNSFREQVAF